jgi:hypothetical protein
MSVLIASLALAATQPVAELPVENEIEVVGKRLRNWSGSWKLRKGALVCKTRRSTGDKAIDAIGCDAIRACLTPHIAKWQAINDADVPREEAQRQFDALMRNNGVYDCIFAEREARIASLVVERRSKRS